MPVKTATVHQQTWSCIDVLWPGRLEQARAAAASSILGSLYLDSGLISVALGMFLIGALWSALWVWSRRYSNSVLAQILYAMGLPFIIILLRGTVTDTLGRALFLVVPLMLLIWLTRLRLSALSSQVPNQSTFYNGKRDP